MPSRPILQACAKSVGPSPSICSASAANVGFVFVSLQRVAHALGVGEGCAVTTSYPEVRSDHHHANSFRTAPSLCADLIFGKDTWKTFLCNHMEGIASIDLFVVPTIAFEQLFAV